MPINSFLYPGAKFIPGYEVANSLRFNSGSSDYLSRSTSTATNSKKYTLSLWVKRGNISSTQVFISYDSGGTAQETIRFSSDNTILWYHRTSGGTTYNLTTNQLFRDVSTWYHIVVAVDTTQGTSSNRVKLYVNGSQVTSFSTETYPAQNLDLFINNNNTVDIFRFQGDSGYFDGYATEVVFIDGTQLDPTSFGEFDEDSPNIWKPKSVLGLTFGTNGFYLDFENASSLGADVSGNSNNFTVNNLTSADQSTDTCTNNFATMNPIAPANISSASDGNLKILQSSSGGSVISTFGFSNGKWYWEVKLDSQVNYTQLAGVIKESKMESALLTSFNVGANDGGWGYFLQGNTDNGKAFHNNSASSVYTTMSAGNILSIAVDSDNGKIYFAVNGTYVNSGDPANGTGAVYTNLPTGENLFPAITNYVGDGSTATLLMNFGSPSFSISSGNSDANGYGNFEYAVPSGFYALNTKNLAEFG
jgi:hypothetical protein